MDDGVIVASLDFALQPARHHIMTPSRGGLVVSLFSLLARGISTVLQYNDTHPDFPLAREVVARYMDKYMVTALVWGLGASMDLAHRKELCAFIASRHHVTLPSSSQAGGGDLCALDCFADVQSGNWRLWQELVPATDVPSHAVLQADAVVPTLDTVRHVVRDSRGRCCIGTVARESIHLFGLWCPLGEAATVNAGSSVCTVNSSMLGNAATFCGCGPLDVCVFVGSTGRHSGVAECAPAPHLVWPAGIGQDHDPYVHPQVHSRL